MNLEMITGKVDDEVKEVIREIDSSLIRSPTELQRQVGRSLEAIGFQVGYEHRANYSRDGVTTTRGRVDILIQRESEIIAIEVDRGSPREKSIQKIKAMAPFTTGGMVVWRG